MGVIMVGTTKRTAELEKLLKQIPESGEIYVSHGWIDSHVHFASSGLFNTSQKSLELQNGVVGFIDAGTVGYLDVSKEVDFINKTQERSAVLSNRFFWRFINVAKHGLKNKQELSDIRFDWEGFSKSMRIEGVLGAKIRASSGPVAGNVEELLGVCKLLRQENIRTMFHVGNEPPLFEQLLPFIKPKDIVTHFFHGKNEAIAKSLKDETPNFFIDVGWGIESFDQSRFEKVFAKKILPTSISTDMHESQHSVQRNYLALMMSHFVDSGMSLEEVVSCVTTNPYQHYVCPKNEQYLNTFTVFEIIDNVNGIGLHDSKNRRLVPKKLIRPIALLGPKGRELYANQD